MKKVALSLILCFLIFIVFSCDARIIGFSVKPSKYDFKETYLGDTDVMHFKVKNASNELYKITKMQILGTGLEHFRISEGGDTPIYVRGGNTVYFAVEYKPKVAGNHNVLIQIYNNAPSGINRIYITGIGVAVPRIEVDKDDIDFGTVLIGYTEKSSIEVENTGTDVLHLSSIMFETSNTPEISINSGANVPILLDPGEKHLIEIEFNPTADVIYSNNLQIVHNAVIKANPLNIPIKGVGRTPIPGIDVNQNSPWDFGDVGIHSPKTLELLVTSNGLDQLQVISIALAQGVDFTIESITDSTNKPVILPSILPVGNSLKVNVKLDPTAVVTYNDTLTIVHDGVNTSSPIDIDLTGDGIILPVTKTFNYTGSMQYWTVPAGVTSIIIEAWGGEGGYDSSSGVQPGKGARMKGEFAVNPGDVINIMVGQKGIRNGGGGASFVCKPNDDPLLISGAGGGSASYTDSANKHGQITTSGGAGAAGGGAGGTNGNGGSAGTSAWNAGAGGGLLTNGADGSSRGGQSYLNGGAGGNSGYGVGGYGGGGGGSGYVVGGGGGGYSGGGGGGNSSGGVGGGGGSYNGGTNQDNTVGINSGDGKVQITY